MSHVAPAVGDLEAALGSSGRVCELTLRGHSRGMAFVDAGDRGPG